MAKTKKRKAASKTYPKVTEKGNGKRKAALILSIIAIAILAISFVYYFVAKGRLLTAIETELQKLPATLEGKDISTLVQIVSNVFLVLAIIWLALAILMLWATILLERGKGKWYVPVIIGIIALLTLRIDAGVFCIVAGVLYK